MRATGAAKGGFTVLEMLIVIAVIAIVCALSLPSIKTMLSGYQLRGSAREIYGAFQLARLEAIKRYSNCTISFGGEVGGEAADCHVYIDLNKNSIWDPGEKILLALSCPSSKGVVLDGANFAKNTLGQPTLSYTPRGLTVSPTGGFGAGTVKVRSERGHILKVIVNAIGRARIASG